MKKIILLAMIGTLFAAGNAFAHCGSCGVGDEAKEHKAECCGKEGKCCHDKKADCEKACDDKKADCKEACEKKKSDSTAAAEAPACCPASKKAVKPA